MVQFHWRLPTHGDRADIALPHDTRGDWGPPAPDRHAPGLIDPSPYHEHLRIAVEEWRNGYARLVCETAPFHANRSGIVHGGVLLSMIDQAAAFAGLFCPLPGRVRRAVTLDLDCRFTGQAQIGGRLVAEGTSSDLTPQVTGGYRLGDVRHIVASPARATAELGFTAEVLPEVGLPEFATAPLRA